MKKKVMGLAAIGLSASMLLTACELPSQLTQLTERLPGLIHREEPEMLSEVEPTESVMEESMSTSEMAREGELRNLEALINSGDAEVNDYLNLASEYVADRRIKDQRDILEQGHMIFPENEDIIELLQSITVNAKEETGLARENLDRLAINLSLADKDEVISAFSEGNWFSTMMPVCADGYRTYYAEEEGGNATVLRVGYDKGIPYSKAWYQQVDGSILYLYKTEGILQVIDQNAQSGFESWLCSYLAGDIYHETGTVANGILTGDYSCGVYSAEADTDTTTLWASREEQEYTSYAGTFGETGQSLIEQPEFLSEIDCVEGKLAVAYAYCEVNQKYLYLVAPGEERSSVTFTPELLGMDAVPEYLPYEAQLAETNAVGLTDIGSVDVRVYNGRIEWFDGTEWHTMGTVEEYIAADPLGNSSEEQESAGLATVNRGRGVSAPVPEEETTDDTEETDGETAEAANSNTGGNSSTGAGTSAPSQSRPAATPSAPVQPAPAPTPAPSNSGDTDIGWSPDMM